MLEDGRSKNVDAIAPKLQIPTPSKSLEVPLVENQEGLPKIADLQVVALKSVPMLLWDRSKVALKQVDPLALALKKVQLFPLDHSEFVLKNVDPVDPMDVVLKNVGPTCLFLQDHSVVAVKKVDPLVTALKKVHWVLGHCQVIALKNAGQSWVFEKLKHFWARWLVVDAVEKARNPHAVHDG